MYANKWKSNNSNLKKIINIKNGFIFAVNNDFTFLKSIIFSLILIIINILFTPNLISKYTSSLFTLFIFLFEFINTIIEMIINRISYKYNLISKNIKDMSACLVFIFTIFYFGFLLFMVKYSYKSYKIWLNNNKNKNILEYIKYTFTK